VQVTQPLTRYQQAVNSQWDLAQFEFAAHGSARWRQSLQRAWQTLMRSPAWRPARWCAGLLLASQLVGMNLAAWQLNAQTVSRKSAQKSMLQETFPNVPVVDAPVQMANELRRLQTASGAVSPRDLEHVLQAVGANLPAGQSISAIDYQAQSTSQGQAETKLQGLQLSGEQVQRWTQSLRGHSLEASNNGSQWRITPLKDAP
jgi:general secretion pathway protein L